MQALRHDRTGRTGRTVGRGSRSIESRNLADFAIFWRRRLRRWLAPT
jgi:hypothetical protein